MRLRFFAIGLPLLLAPAMAAAIDCATISDLPAISQHYVQPTLDRANAGIAYATASREAADFFSLYVPGWARNIGGTMAALVNSRQALTVRSDDLSDATACLRYDQILLECKIDEVRRAMDAELERGSFVGIMRLQKLVLFLQERLDHLTLGSADGSYADGRWDFNQLFDENEPEELSEPLCPFHSDYTPPRMTGYGCDTTVLETIVSNASDMSFAQAELDALEKIESEIEEFRKITDLMNASTGNKKVRVVVTIGTARQADPNNLPNLSDFATTTWPPRVLESSDRGNMFFTDLSPDAAEGAAQINMDVLRQKIEEYTMDLDQSDGEVFINAFFWHDNTGIIVTNPAYMLTNVNDRFLFSVEPYAPSEEGPSARRPHLTLIGCQEETGFCSDDSELVCGSTEFCASKGKGECLRDDSSPTIPKRALRGAFSYTTDHLRLLTDFAQKRIEDGFSRTFPAAWAPIEDLPEGYSTEERPGDEVIPGMVPTTIRQNFRNISGIQGRGEGWIFPEAQDSQLEIAESLSDMRASIGELSRLASTKTGVRALVIDFAYFLRRTCVFRPCQRSLEQIIRISLEDACFPYTDGDFLKDTPKNPRWKKCAMAACIQVDDGEDNQIELPENCEEILPPPPE